ncbi:adenylate/guanylate cyclase domain-containing protein [Ruegeria lacuscaerulensis]|uniref:adenylate/guanylate cyclase domain-containing protein n=1 Tax=Ruegeria lacuscaerulensis TaxID=55218 RepID=UPI001480ACB9|nr:adenylate/guanylate cyclase domain-containing protein [Ruegeria lacuscaerulensis]
MGVLKTKSKQTSDSDWHASMSVALALGLGFFVLTSVAGVLGVGLVVGYRNTSELLTQKAQLIIGAQRHQVERYLNAASAQIDFIASRITSSEVDADGSEEFVSLLLGAVSATPQILRIQFIDRNHVLTGVERVHDETLPIFLRIGDDVDLLHLVKGTIESGESRWGDILWREEYGQAVLNYQKPVVRQGRIVGVLSAWVSVVKLSEFLADQEMEFGANVFMLYGRNAVLAHPLMAFGYAGLNRSAPLPQQDRFSDPIVSAMWQPNDRFSVAKYFLTGANTRFVGYAEWEYVIFFDELSDYGALPLTVATYFEAHDIIAEAARLKWAIVFCLVMAGISAGTAALIGQKIAKPVRRLSDSAKRVHDLDVSNIAEIEGSFFRELDEAARSYNFMLDGLRWFELYVPKRLVRQLMRQHTGKKIDSSHRDVVIMFTDIVEFTALSEHLTAPQTAMFLNEHFAGLADCIQRNGGTIDKFIGDSVMAIWGALEHQDDAADLACNAALEIARWIEEYNQHRRARAELTHTVRLRIGIHIGRVVVGNIGSEGRLSYTVVGDSVNVAQRLEEAGRVLGNIHSEVNILTSSTVRSALVKPLEFERIGAHKLRGREELVEIYSLKLM